MKSDSYITLFLKAILAGLCIGLGGIVYLVTENKYLGSLLFSLGLFTILRYGFALYTGKVGYIPEREPIYLAEVGLTLCGNAVGTGLTALLVRLTRIGAAVHEAAANAMAVKTGDSFLSRLLLGVFCGVLMFIAVDNGNRCKAEKNDVSFVFGTVVPVMVFILCGFNHSVADCFYYFAGMSSPADILPGLLYILTVAAGNALGGMLIPLCLKAGKTAK